MAQDENTFLAEYSKFLDSSDKHLTYSALSIYRNDKGKLSEKEIRFLAMHLDSCDLCAKKLQEVVAVEGELLDGRKATVYWMNTPVFRYSIAAVLIVAIGVSLAYYINKSRERQSSFSRVPGQSIAAETPDPERFASNPLLENFMGRTVRSAVEARFLSPANGDTLATPFTFRWEDGKKEQTFTLTVVDNKNVEMWKGSAQTGTLTLEKSLEPGLYYTKLEVGGALVQVCKFIVAHRQ